MKSALSIALRVLALTVILFICFSLAGVLFGPRTASAEEQAGAFGTLLAVCFIQSAILSHIILRSRWAGWKLFAAIAVVFYGVSTLMPQMESAVFIKRLPAGTLPRLFLMGAIIAVPFSALAVLVLGKRKHRDVASERTERLVMPINEWVWKLALIALVYVILYFTFGYFIAWRVPAVREYYGGGDAGGFFNNMRSVLRDTPGLIPFQALRGLLWALLALPIVRMMRGRWQETALALGLLFGVLMTAPLLLPNPFMPEAVRLTHLIETASSTFIFGFFAGWLLARPAVAR